MIEIRNLLIASALLLISLHAQKPTLPDILDPDKATNTTNIHSTFKRTGPTVQIGILLDTSGSMNGLIDQAKDQIWKIVNEVAKANKNNKEVTIQVGLFEYGKSSIPRYEGYMQMLSPLSEELDKVSQKLFALRTNGSEEYAGKVILEAVNRFAWSSHKDDLKLLIIAGNEEFDQGNVPYAEAIKKAKANHIIVNTIFCGDYNRGVRLEWKDGAIRGLGKYFNINHNDRRVYIATPYDDEIILLGKKLNKTYIYYGRKHKERMLNMAAQDSNSKRVSKSSYIERNLVKAKKQYSSAKWDMVDAYTKNVDAALNVSAEALPSELKGKDKKEMKKILEKTQKERKSIQAQINSLEKKRKVFISKKSSKKDDNLGDAIIKSIKKQAHENGFVFSK